jgi:hypothetical protein
MAGVEVGGSGVRVGGADRMGLDSSSPLHALKRASQAAQRQSIPKNRFKKIYSL